MDESRESHPVSPVNQVYGENIKVRLLLAGVSELQDVVCDLAATVVLWGVPGQVARVRFDVRDHDVLWRKRSV